MLVALINAGNMTQTNIDEKNIVLKDTLVKLGEIVANKLYLGLPVDDMLDTKYVGDCLIYAADCSSLAYNEEMRDVLYEMMDRLVMRCQKYA